MATDYEKKYKEALERAKRLTSDMTTLQKIREFIFPELVESEDERIRKELMEFVNWAVSRGSVRNDWLLKKCPEKWIAYLEKQKEQKPVPPLPPFDEMTPEDKMNHPLYLEGFDMGRDMQKVFDEQKPAEWSEEDEDNLCRVIRVLEDNDSDWKELSNWLKSLRPSWKPSEEQMRALNEIVNILAASPFLHQNDYLFNILNGLREELKKLL